VWYSTVHHASLSRAVCIQAWPCSVAACVTLLFNCSLPSHTHTPLILLQLSGFDTDCVLPEGGDFRVSGKQVVGRICGEFARPVLRHLCIIFVTTDSDKVKFRTAAMFVVGNTRYKNVSNRIWRYT
jgi:hypothetical protein